MGTQPKIIDLLEQYIEANGQSEKWITVEEFRAFFHMKRDASPEITGILRRLYKNPTFVCLYKVTRIEKYKETIPPNRIFKRYFVQRRTAHQNHRLSEPSGSDIHLLIQY